MNSHKHTKKKRNDPNDENIDNLYTFDIFKDIKRLELIIYGAAKRWQT